MKERRAKIGELTLTNEFLAGALTKAGLLSAKKRLTEPLRVCRSGSIAISMDGKGAWRDNAFVERLWRSIKYEKVYLRAYASVSEARASLGQYIYGFYDTRRPHSSLDRQAPDEAYSTAPPSIPMAA